LVEGGKAPTLFLSDEPINRLEIQGAAYGGLTWTPRNGVASKIGWGVSSGQWSLTQGLDANGDATIDGTGESRSVA
jgi:hypothetical protein